MLVCIQCTGHWILCSHAETDLGGLIKDRMSDYELYFKSDLLKLE
jgi:hypothetical protein